MSAKRKEFDEEKINLQNQVKDLHKQLEEQKPRVPSFKVDIGEPSKISGQLIRSKSRTKWGNHKVPESNENRELAAFIENEIQVKSSSPFNQFLEQEDKIINAQGGVNDQDLEWQNTCSLLDRCKVFNHTF